MNSKIQVQINRENQLVVAPIFNWQNYEYSHSKLLGKNLDQNFLEQGCITMEIVKMQLQTMNSQMAKRSKLFTKQVQDLICSLSRQFDKYSQTNVQTNNYEIFYPKQFKPGFMKLIGIRLMQIGWMNFLVWI